MLTRSRATLRAENKGEDHHELIERKTPGRHSRLRLWWLGRRQGPAARPAGVDEYGLDIVHPDGSPARIEARAKVWAAGVEASALGARLAARTVVRRLGGDATPREFRYHDVGTMATVSRFRAVASLGPVRIGGAVAWLLWLVVHLAFLTGFKNRVATVARWAIAFLGRGRPERTITEQQVFVQTRQPEPAAQEIS